MVDWISARRIVHENFDLKHSANTNHSYIFVLLSILGILLLFVCSVPAIGIFPLSCYTVPYNWYFIFTFMNCWL